MEIKLSEADIKSAIYDYLLVKENQGEVAWFERLQAGEIIEVRGGESRRRVKLCRPGTPDFIIVLPQLPNTILPNTIFLEVKTVTGKLTPTQKDFQVRMREKGVTYHIVRSLEELVAIFWEWGLIY